MSLILVVDVEMLFRQQFKRELRAGLFRMDFALSADSALQRGERGSMSSGAEDRRPQAQYFDFVRLSEAQKTQPLRQPRAGTTASRLTAARRFVA
jgi:hypothetical protein